MQESERMKELKILIAGLHARLVACLNADSDEFEMVCAQMTALIEEYRANIRRESYEKTIP